MLIQLWGVTKVYGEGGQSVKALDGIFLDFSQGTFTAIMGPSGSGKSTLLHCASGLDSVTEGQVVVAGTEVGRLPEHARTLLRRKHIGFVFQAFNLVTSLTAAQNVELPLRLAGRRPERRAVVEALAEVGLADRAHHRPSELSGGQQQRVAIARALITKPDVVFADEPTGALDTGTSKEVLDLLRRMVVHYGQTIVAVTHDPMVASHADRVVFLKDGRVVDELKQASPAETIAARMARLEV
jgi:putative ABC transport system ATP-binding protein